MKQGKSVVVVVLFACAMFASASGLKWAKSYSAAIAQGKKAGKVVMLDFTASWCVNCHKLDRTTYVDPKVVSALGNVIPVHVDYDKEKAIAKKYKVEPLPVILFIDPSGKILGRIDGYVNASQFLAKAKPALAKAKKK